jgi:hypothetical protein
VSALQIGRFWNLNPARGQMLVSHANSTIALLTLEGRRLVEDASVKTAKRSTESLLAVGDIDGDKKNEIVQTVGNNLYIMDLIPE